MATCSRNSAPATIQIRPPGSEEASLDQQQHQRLSVYPPVAPNPEADHMLAFKLQSGNADFRASVLTYIFLTFLLIVYPVLSLSLEWMGEGTAAALENLNQGVLIIGLIVTIIFQWTIFLVNYVAIHLEKSNLPGIGLTRLRAVDFAWGGAFFLAAYTLLSGLAWLLAQVGLPLPGEIGLLIPTDPFGQVIWVVISFTAGFCEEVAFRGYLMTRLRMMGRFKTWIIPSLISALAFGISHAYQGLPGVILITVYALLFSLLYIRTGRLWPCIIAHFFQDFGALFLPQ